MKGNIINSVHVVAHMKKAPNLQFHKWANSLNLFGSSTLKSRVDKRIWWRGLSLEMKHLPVTVLVKSLTWAWKILWQHQSSYWLTKSSKSLISITKHSERTLESLFKSITASLQTLLIKESVKLKIVIWWLWKWGPRPSHQANMTKSFLPTSSLSTQYRYRQTQRSAQTSPCRLK